MAKHRLAALALTALAAATGAARADEPKFQKVDINPGSVYEAAGAFDVDGDGDLDILSGAYWYEAPAWTKHKVRDVQQVGTYMNCFSTIPMDVDADGDIDFVSVSYFGKNIGWVENPGPGHLDQAWAYHQIDEPGPSEAAAVVDIDGDGKLDILPNTVNTVVWYSLDQAGKTPKWTKHQLPQEAGAHGVGTGDINRDGKLDILTPRGWLEAPEDPRSDHWAWHPDWDLGPTGIQILGKDFDGDGDVDLIYGNGHAIGLYWAEQTKGEGGKPTWKKHLIDDSVTSVHTLLWTDLDGDGKKDELLTGKRVYAHEVEPGDTQPSVIAYYRFNKASKAWDRHEIYKSAPANAPAEGPKRDAQKDWAPGTAGTGLEIAAVDIDADGDIDLVCPGKSGLYLFVNQSKSNAK